MDRVLKGVRIWRITKLGFLGFLLGTWDLVVVCGGRKGWMFGIGFSSPGGVYYGISKCVSKCPD
ncbi:hypothetical protein QJS04_geneDACA013005 [Acorus gramineus]|uniref:Transmembrane protein n=1 Tax=Acorus gramineus TaxID=55184 RepID=A0AAV9B765_ACOGR|nr:hypothetical protein QJS04_geneDACA013005 [Acorus gramineus]